MKKHNTDNHTDNEIVLDTDDVVNEPDDDNDVDGELDPELDPELEQDEELEQEFEDDNDNDKKMQDENENENDDFTNCLDIEEPEINISDTVVDDNKRTSKNKMTRYEFVRIIGERILQLTKGAKPLIKQNKQHKKAIELSEKEIAIEELKANMIPFKIRRFVKDHYEIWKIEELNKKHLEPLFY